MADDDDDPQLRSLRAAWRSLPDEDPPERGLAELMAAARQHAEAMAEARTPWWKRALAAMMRPPMLALASVLVLLGGVFVVTSSHKGVTPEPAPMERREAPALTPPQAPAATPARLIVPAPPIGGATEESTTTAAPTPAPVRSPASPPARPAKTVRHAAPSAKPADTISNPFGSRAEESPAGGESNGPGGAKPPPAMEPAPTATKNDDTDGAAEDKPATRGPVAKKSVGDPSTPRRQLDDDLLAQCRAAATRGDCELAKKIARRIASDDAAYYGANVTTDATIAGCLGK